MAGQRRSKRGKKNKRDRELRKKNRERAANSTPRMVLGGPIENRECLLDLYIAPPSDEFNPRAIKALVDTGATVTVIRPELAAELGLPFVGEVSVNSANGVVPAKVFAARLLLQSGKKLVTGIWPVVTMNVTRPEMLFGMDAMAGGVLKVNLIKGTWEWRLMKTSGRTVAFAAVQSPPEKPPEEPPTVGLAGAA